MREPSGSRDRRLSRPGATPAHWAVKGRTTACFNFAPADTTPGRITVRRGECTVWQSRAEHPLQRFRSEERETAQGGLLLVRPAAHDEERGRRPPGQNRPGAPSSSGRKRPRRGA